MKSKIGTLACLSLIASFGMHCIKKKKSESSPEASQSIGKANFTDGSIRSTPCEGHLGAPKADEATPFCTGNLMSAVPLPTLRMSPSIVYNSLDNPIYINTDSFRAQSGFGFKRTLSIQSEIQILDNDRAIMLSGDRTATDLVKNTDGTWQPKDYRLSSIKIAINGGQAVTQSLPGMPTYTYEGFSPTRFVIKKIEGLAGAVTFNYSGGILASVSYPDGLQEVFTQVGGFIKEVTDVYGSKYTLAYDTSGNLKQVAYPDGSNYLMTHLADIMTSHALTSVTDTTGATTSYTYAGGGVVNSVTDSRNFVTAIVYERSAVTAASDFSYVKYTFSDYSSGTKVMSVETDGKTSTFERETDTGRLVKVTNAQGAESVLTYADSSDRVASMTSDGKTTSFVYDAQGLLKSSSLQGKGSGTIRTEYTRDDIGRVLTETVNGNTTTYEYANGQLTGVTDFTGMKVYVATYDAKGRLTSKSNRFNLTTTNTYDDQTLSYIEDPLGRRTTFQYDRFNRPVTVVYPDGTVATVKYDNMNRVVSTVMTRNGLVMENSSEMERNVQGLLTKASVSTAINGKAIQTQTVEYGSPTNPSQEMRVSLATESGSVDLMNGRKNNDFNALRLSAPYPSVP